MPIDAQGSMAGDAGVNQQQQNQQTRDTYNNAAAQGQYPYAQQGTQAAAQVNYGQPSPNQAPTFSQLQQQGVARPAPVPQVPGAFDPNRYIQPGFQPTGNLSGDLRSMIQSSLANPDPYGNEYWLNQFQSQARGIDDEYSMNQKRLEEDMARRGLSASSILGGRMADLNVGKRSAYVDLADRLASQRADKFASARQAAIQSALGLDAADREDARFSQQMGLQRDDLGLRQKELEMRGNQWDQTFAFDKEKFNTNQGNWQKEFDQRGDQWGKEYDFKTNSWQKEFDQRGDHWQKEFDFTKDSWQSEFDAGLLKLFGIDTTDVGPEAGTDGYGAGPGAGQDSGPYVNPGVDAGGDQITEYVRNMLGGGSPYGDYRGGYRDGTMDENALIERDPNYRYRGY